MDVALENVQVKNMLNKAEEKFISTLSRQEQKQIGQFTTPQNIANYMSDRLLENNFCQKHSTFKILDPGAGTGVLGISLVQKIFSINSNAIVQIVSYENDNNALKVLKHNYKLIFKWAKNNNLKFTYTIKPQNYILDGYNLFDYGINNHENEYDLIISNPPYKKLRKDSEEATAMPFIVHGAPNLYGLFWAKSIIELKPNSNSIFIIPRSWMSGSYFTKLRQFIFSQGNISEIHSFEARKNKFGNAKVLQELVIVVFKKRSAINQIRYFTHNSVSLLDKTNYIMADKANVVVGKEQRIYLVNSKKDIETLKWANRFSSTVEKSGLKMKTGLTVCFRNKSLLEDEGSSENVPIIFSDNISKHSVHLNRKKDQFLKKKRNGLLQNNQDYIFVKRFSSKEEKRRIQTAYYNSSRFSKYDQISTDNKLNFVIAENDNLLKGAYLFLSSTKFDEYYRLLGSNTQVNSTEINTMKCPSKQQLIELGQEYDAQHLESMEQNMIDKLISNI